MRIIRHLLTLGMVGVVIFWSCSPTLVSEDSDNHFYFVQITDTHFSDGDNYERVEKIVEAINKLPMEIKCVIHTGDLVSDNIEQDSILIRGLSILNKLEVPIHYLPGNHDILEKDLDATRQQYQKYFGPLISVEEYAGVQFIQVFTEPLAHGFKVAGFDPLEELEQILKQGAGKPAIVFHHTPSPADFYKNSMHVSWDPEAQEKWVNLLNSYNVKAVMAGHYHRDEHHWLGDVPLYVSASVGGWWGRQASFRIFEYNNGKLGYRTQYIQMTPWRNE